MSTDKQGDAGWINHLPAIVKKRFAGRPYLQQVVGNTGWIFADNIGRMLIGLIVGIWVARYLGPVFFGDLNFALSLVAVFSVMASLGMDNNVVRDLVREPTKQNEILGTAFRLKLIGSILMAVACIGLVWVLRQKDSQMIWLTAILSFGMVFLALETISLWFRSQVQSKYTVYAKTAAYLIGALIRIILVLRQAPLIAFAWAVLIESIVGSAGLIYVYMRKDGRTFRAWTASWSRAMSILQDGWPALLTAVNSMLYLRLDMVMLGEMSGDRAVGIYAVATRLSEVWYFLPMAIVSSVLPSLVQTREHSRELYLARLAQLYRLMSAISILVSLSVMFLAKSVITLLYGAQYQEAGAVLAVHIWASVAVFLGVASGQYLILENLQKLSFYRTALGLACNVLLNLMLIPPLGPLGAAIATLVSYSVAAFSVILFPQARLQATLMLQSLLPSQWRLLIKHSV